MQWINSPWLKLIVVMAIVLMLSFDTASAGRWFKRRRARRRCRPCARVCNPAQQAKSPSATDSEMEAPEAPAAPPAPSEHYCAKHQIKYDPYSDGRYGHKWNDDKHWCLEGSESLLDNEGNPVNEAML